MRSEDDLSTELMVRYEAHPDKLSSTLGDEEVVLCLHSGTYYGLNEVGTRIWALLSSPQTLDELCSILETEYDVDRQTLQADTARLLSQMEDEGLIRVHEDGA